MIQELSLAEMDYVNGAGEVGDAIRAAGEAGKEILNNTYEAFYKLGTSVRSLFV